MLARLTPADIEARRRELGLDQPIPIRYFSWLGDVLQGDLGYSIVSGRSIADEVGGRLGPSLTLMLVAAAIAILVGVPSGVLSAVHQYGASTTRCRRSRSSWSAPHRSCSGSSRSTSSG